MHAHGHSKERRGGQKGQKWGLGIVWKLQVRRLPALHTCTHALPCKVVLDSAQCTWHPLSPMHMLWPPTRTLSCPHAHALQQVMLLVCKKAASGASKHANDAFCGRGKGPQNRYLKKSDCWKTSCMRKPATSPLKWAGSSSKNWASFQSACRTHTSA